MTSTTTTTRLDTPNHGSFTYYNSLERPELDDTSAFRGTSTDLETFDLPVKDLRKGPLPLSSYNHQTHGFQILHQPLPISPTHASVHDGKIMKSEYYPSMTSLLVKAMGARSAVVVNHTLRDIAEYPKDFDPKHPRNVESLPPFMLVHSDYTPAGARSHLRAIESDWFEKTGALEGTTEAEREEFFRLKDEIIAAEDAAIKRAGLEPGTRDKGGHWDWDGSGYDGPRYAMFSVWRPWETVKRDPLGFFDMSGVEMKAGVDYVPLPRKYRSRPGHVDEYYSENVLIQPPGEKKHPWCYVSNQTPEEVYTLKFYDSEAPKDPSIPLMCGHSAFQLEGTENEPMRRSCELRMWCIW